MQLDDEIIKGTTQFFAVLINCPFGKATCHCPFGKIRNESKNFEQRFQSAESLASNHDQSRNLWRAHIDCYNQRLSGINKSQESRRLDKASYATC